jgi:hypothetical protein
MRASPLHTVSWPLRAGALCRMGHHGGACSTPGSLSRSDEWKQRASWSVAEPDYLTSVRHTHCRAELIGSPGPCDARLRALSLPGGCAPGLPAGLLAGLAFAAGHARRGSGRQRPAADPLGTVQRRNAEKRPAGNRERGLLRRDVPVDASRSRSRSLRMAVARLRMSGCCVSRAFSRRSLPSSSRSSLVRPSSRPRGRAGPVAASYGGSARTRPGSRQSAPRATGAPPRGGTHPATTAPVAAHIPSFRAEAAEAVRLRKPGGLQRLVC